MPTAIDEYRIEKEKGILGARWPLSGSGSGVTLYSLPPGYTDHEHLKLLLEKPRAVGDDIDGLLRQLENQIKLEIAFRDHHLVVCNPNVLVFRPFFSEGDVSSGVKAELEHWKSLARNDGARRAVIIHFLEDVDIALRRHGHEIRQDIERAAAGILSRPDYGITPREAEEMVKRRGRTGGPSLLDRGRLPSTQDVEEKWPEVLTEAQREVIWRKLTVVELPPERAAVWILAESEELIEKMDVIASFLLGHLDSESDDLRDWEMQARRLVEKHQ